MLRSPVALLSAGTLAAGSGAAVPARSRSCRAAMRCRTRFVPAPGR
jgi:hypothetical protein